MSHKQVRIIVPEVHDGLGGIHRDGDTPMLPAELADLFVKNNLAVEGGAFSAAEAKKIAADQAAQQAAVDQKARAEAVMKRHDQLPPEVRAAEREAERADVVAQHREVAAKENRAARRARQQVEGAKPGDDVSDLPETKH